MPAYADFAAYYDSLTRNVDYARWADYWLELSRRVGHEPGLTLDLACGTGSLTLELYRRGVDVYGIDGSVEMLSQAREKCAEAGADILFLCQKMQALDLYGTVDTTFCTLDSLNHLAGPEELQRAFDKVSFFTNPGGYFFFDMNTPYKHDAVLGGNTFVYDTQNVYCVWQNRVAAQHHRVDITLDFFALDGRRYTRSTEHFSEWAYPAEEVQAMLQKAGFGAIQTFHELTFDPPKPDSQRLVYAAQKL